MTVMQAIVLLLLHIGLAAKPAVDVATLGAGAARDACCRVVVVVPTNVLQNWMAELDLWLGHFSRVRHRDKDILTVVRPPAPLWRPAGPFHRVVSCSCCRHRFPPRSQLLSTTAGLECSARPMRAIGSASTLGCAATTIVGV